MNPETQIENLLTALLSDFERPDFWWQIGVLLICLGVARLIARSLRGQPLSGTGKAWQLGEGGIKRIAFPVIALMFVAVARAILRDWHPVNLLSIAIPLLSSLAVIRMVFYVLRYSLSPSGWLANFERTFAFLVWSVVALHILGLLPEVIALIEAVTFSVGKQQLNLWLMSQGIFMVIVTLFVALWLSGFADAQIMRAQGIDSNLRVVFSRLSKALLITIAVLVALPLVGLDLTMLSVFGGALGVGLGFGLQKIASNYVAGFIILLDRSIRIGNIISVSGQRGKVKQITTRYTVLRNADGNEAIVPNEMIIGSTVLNEPYTEARMKILLRVRVTYASDLERAMQLMVEAAAKQPMVLKDPKPIASATEFTDVGIFIDLVCWIDEPQLGGWQQLRSDIGVEIWKAFRAAGVELH